MHRRNSGKSPAKTTLVTCCRPACQADIPADRPARERAAPQPMAIHKSKPMSAVCINKARRVRHADAVTWFYHLTRLLLTRHSSPFISSPLFNSSIRFKCLPSVRDPTVLTTGPRRQKTNGCSFWLRPDQWMALRLEKPVGAKRSKSDLSFTPLGPKAESLPLGVSSIESKMGKTRHFPSFACCRHGLRRFSIIRDTFPPLWDGHVTATTGHTFPVRWRVPSLIPSGADLQRCQKSAGRQ